MAYPPPGQTDSRGVKLELSWSLTCRPSLSPRLCFFFSKKEPQLAWFHFSISEKGEMKMLYLQTLQQPFAAV